MPPTPRLHLIDARSSRGLSQNEVANRLGTTHVNVSRWERGITRPSPYFRRKLCVLFGETEEALDLVPAPKKPVQNDKKSEVPEQLQADTQTEITAQSSTLSNSEDVSTPAPALPIDIATDTNTKPQALYDPAIPLLPAIKLIGREEDLERIKKQLCERGNVALTALNGLPGVGKTALSIALAHDTDIRTHFTDGVLWAGLGPNPNMAGLLSRWGTLLGIPATQMANLNNIEAWARAIRIAIGSRSMLLVIDDAWRLEEALTFRVGGSNCAHLVTTRFPNIAAHMSVNGATMLKELNEENSIKLLDQLAPQVLDRERQKIHDLVQAVGGLPLALTLMGNYLRKQAYSGPARRVTAALERLSHIETRLSINEPHIPAESHPSLPVDTALSIQSVLSVTDQVLEEKVQKALYALSIFPAKPNTFSEEAALAVAACGYDELDALSDAGLIESIGGDRYQLHQIITDYARLRLKAQGNDAAYDRLITYVVDYVETHKKDYELLELESSSILAAIEYAYTLRRQDEYARAVCAFAPFLILRGFYEQAKFHLERARELAENANNDQRLADTLLYLGQIAEKQGDYALGETHYITGLKLARKTESNEQICEFLRGLGGLVLRKGEITQAETYLQEGLKLSRSIQKNELIYNILNVLASIAFNRDDYRQAQSYLQEGLNLAKQLEDREQICFLLGNVGAIAAVQGNYQQAQSYFQESLALSRQIGHREQACLMLNNLGDIANTEGNYQQAEIYIQEGLELARQIGHREWTSALLTILGQTCRKQQNYIQAENYLQEGLELAKKINQPKMTVELLYEYGNLYLDTKQANRAETTFRNMKTIIPPGNQEWIALADYGIARALATKGNLQEAYNIGMESLSTLEAIGNHQKIEVKQWLNLIKK
ncbi:MAG TPA: tetratricopeptide repeat protein [Dictyobacter sp.]|nr:tetratricopeptide repeat protein [Dictyobacter sp.]